MDASHIHVVQEFNAEGATLSTTLEKPHALECLMMVGAVFQLLAEVLYKRYREDKRFALQTRLPSICCFFFFIREKPPVNRHTL